MMVAIVALQRPESGSVRMEPSQYRIRCDLDQGQQGDAFKPLAVDALPARSAGVLGKGFHLHSVPRVLFLLDSILNPQPMKTVAGAKPWFAAHIGRHPRGLQ